MDIKLLTGIIAAITSIITVIVSLFLRNRIEKRFHVYKVKIEHEFEQRKKIKEVLSKYKTHLINSADSLKGRLSNILVNYEMGGLNVNGNFNDQDAHFFQSTIYRFLRFLAWLKIMDDELIFLDTTIASDEDLYFIKYLRAMKRSLQDERLFNDLEFNSIEDRRRDLILRDNLEEISTLLIKSKTEVDNYSEFKNSIENNLHKYVSLCQLIDGISPIENRRRWDRIYCLYVLLMSFLNSYGYDFLYTDKESLTQRIKLIQKYDIFPNLKSHIMKYKLNKELEIQKLMSEIEKYSS